MMKVLVVDDEKDIEMLFRQRFRKELRSGELELAFAFSGEEALEYLETKRADVVLVLSDINMPGMNGLELLRRVKELPPPPKPPLPVCIMTAYGTEEYKKNAVALGADGFVTKPLDFEDLKRRIRAFAAAA